MSGPARTALVLSGGGARGAYEVGVISYLREELPRRLGFSPHFDIICGTSVGAVNAAFMASSAHALDTQGSRLARHWRDLHVDRVFDLSAGELMRAIRLLLGGAPPPSRPGELRRGGLLNSGGLERMVIRSVAWDKISKNIAAGYLSALSVSATHVATGKTVVFVERHGGGLPPWSRDPFVQAQAGQIGPLHVLASAAIPVLFPAVSVNDAFYCDGGLRQNTPISPALRLGADRVLVISLRHLETKQEDRALSVEHEDAYPSPWFLFGKSLNALLLDHTDYDIVRLERLNAIISGGVAAYGPGFVGELDRVLTPLRGQGLRYVQPLMIRPSEDIGVLAGNFARGPHIAALGGLSGRMLRYLSESSYTREADLLSYVLFDGNFAAELMELGKRDARAREDELVAFFTEARAAGSIPGPGPGDDEERSKASG